MHMADGCCQWVATAKVDTSVDIQHWRRHRLRNVQESAPDACPAAAQAGGCVLNEGPGGNDACSRRTTSGGQEKGQKQMEELGRW